MFKKLIYCISLVSICSNIHAGGTNKEVMVDFEFHFGVNNEGFTKIQIEGKDVFTILINDELLDDLAKLCTITGHKSRNECIKECITNHLYETGLFFFQKAGGVPDAVRCYIRNRNLELVETTVNFSRDGKGVDFVKLISDRKKQGKLSAVVIFVCRNVNKDNKGLKKGHKAGQGSKPRNASNGYCLCKTRASSDR